MRFFWCWSSELARATGPWVSCFVVLATTLDRSRLVENLDACVVAVVFCGVTELAVVDKMMDWLALRVLCVSVDALVVGIVFVVLFPVVAVARAMQLGSNRKNNRTSDDCFSVRTDLEETTGRFRVGWGRCIQISIPSGFTFKIYAHMYLESHICMLAISARSPANWSASTIWGCCNTEINKISSRSRNLLLNSISVITTDYRKPTATKKRGSFVVCQNWMFSTWLTLRILEG